MISTYFMQINCKIFHLLAQKWVTKVDRVDVFLRHLYDACKEEPFSICNCNCSVLKKLLLWTIWMKKLENLMFFKIYIYMQNSEHIRFV